MGLLAAQTAHDGSIRFRLHHFVRIFGNELLAAELSATERADAQRRLLSGWLCLVGEAHRAMYGGDFASASDGCCSA